MSLELKNKKKLLAEKIEKLDIDELEQLEEFLDYIEKTKGQRDKITINDFMEAFGLWKDRQIDAAALRKQAWRITPFPPAANRRYVNSCGLFGL